MSDAINPAHYKVGSMECIDVIEALGLNFHLGSAFAYLWRAGRKTEDPHEDIRKCVWYLNRWLEKNK
jgi:hypothetical protein